MDDEVLIDRILEEFDQHMAAKAAQIGADTMRMAERQITLQVLDQLWREHIQNMMRLREGVTLRAFGQRDPLAEYRRDGFEMFDGLLERHRNSVVVVLANLEVRQAEPPQAAPAAAPGGAAAGGAAAAGTSQPQGLTPPPTLSVNGTGTGTGTGQITAEQMKKTKRNEPCPCGSGKKFKQCHGAAA